MYNIVASLNDIGGFYPGVYIIGLLLYLIFRESFFSAALIKKLY